MRKYEIRKFSRFISCVLSLCIIAGIVLINPAKMDADVLIDGIDGVNNFSLDIYRADYYLENGTPANNAVQSMLSLIYPSQTIVDELNKRSFSKKVAAWKLAHFATSPSEIIDGKLDEKGYYEAIILSIYVSQADNSMFLYDQTKKINSEANAILKNISEGVKQKSIIDNLSKISKNQKISSLSSKEQDAIMKKCEELFKENHPILDGSTYFTGNLKTVFSSSTTIIEAFERMCAYTQLCDLSLQQKAVLQEMYDICPDSNPVLKSALAEVASSMDSYNDAIIAAIGNAALEQGAQFTGVLADEGWEAVIKANPYSAAFLAGASIGTFIGDTICSSLFSTDKTIEQYVKMQCLCEISQLMQSVLSNFEKAYQKNKTDQNAENYFEAVDAIFAIASLSCDFATEYGEILYEDAFVGKIFKKTEDKEHYYKTISQTKNSYQNIHKIVANNYLYQLKDDNPKAYNIIMGIEDVVRDVVLVLDSSGSMGGEPMNQTKQAALNFLDTVFEQEEASRVSIVTYDSTAYVNCELTDDEQELTECIESIYSGGNTNMYSGLQEADRMLQESTIEKKIIVLMSDGLPNEGVSDSSGYSEPLLQFAAEMKSSGYYIYTLGFFMSVDSSEIYNAQQLMEGIASPGLHYEVESADDLVFFFEDIANQISGTRYVHIRIACPVDVTVKSGEDVLSSKADAESKRAPFGTLTYETIQDEDENGNISEDRVKILRLNMEKDYDVEIEGYGTGTMDYTVSFPNESGEYDDVRSFPDIEVTESTKATSNTGAADATYLEVDKNGDGKADVTYKTEANGKMEEVKDHTVLYIVLIVTAVFAILILILVIVLIRVSGKKKNSGQRGTITGEICGAFGIYQGKSYPIGPGGKCIVGRKTSCDIQLVHGQVSRVHCIIEMLPDGVYQVTDYSSNGTFYNDQKLKNKQPYRLPKGALLAIGDADNILELK